MNLVGLPQVSKIYIYELCSGTRAYPNLLGKKDYVVVVAPVQGRVRLEHLPCTPKYIRRGRGTLSRVT